MKERVLDREQVLDVGIEAAFDFFSKAENLEAITPPWLGFRITSPNPIEMGVGTEIRYRLRLHGIPVRWRTRIEEWDPPADGTGGFVDRQISGPYALWHHSHRFESISAGRTRMTDTVHYGHRFGPLGSLAERLIVARDLRRIFDYRRDSIADLITAEQGAVPA